jgi:hypothetical protein
MKRETVSAINKAVQATLPPVRRSHLIAACTLVIEAIVSNTQEEDRKIIEAVANLIRHLESPA